MPQRRWLDSILDFLDANQRILILSTYLSLGLLLVSLVVIPWAIARIPPDYFSRGEAPHPTWTSRRPLLYVLFNLLRNGFGLVLVLLGAAMLFLPGQGLLTILVGFGVMNFPGKRRLELRLVRFPRVLRTLNWIRARAGQAPLLPPR